MDAKLLTARAEIEAVLKRHDIAAWFILHNAPGEIEVFAAFQPSYSVLHPVTDAGGKLTQIRIRSKASDYAGDREKQLAHQAATANMVSGFATVMGGTALQLLELSMTIDAAFGAEHTPLQPSTGQRQ